MQTVFGHAPLFMLDAAVRLGIFDALAAGPKSVSEIARACAVSERGARMLLDALAALNWLEGCRGAYSLAPETAAFLVHGTPGYFGGLLRHAVDNLLPRWMDLTEAVRTGKSPRPVNEESAGAEFFTDFVGDLFGPNFLAAEVLAKALPAAGKPEPFSVLDLAAGSGVWGIAIALRSQHARVTAVDWKNVLAVTRKKVAQFQLEDRFRFVPGDLMEADFGSGHAAAVMGHILHMNGPEWAHRLLRRTHEALAPGGTIAIAEWLVNDDRSGPPTSLIFAINMLVHEDAGDTYSFAEIAGWLRECGFRNARKLDAPGPSPLVLAEKVG